MSWPRQRNANSVMSGLVHGPRTFAAATPLAGAAQDHTGARAAQAITRRAA